MFKLFSFKLSSMSSEEHVTGSSLYSINISKHLGEEYVGMLDDIARFVVIQIAIQMMLCMMDPARFKFFAPDFLMLLVFIVIGVLLYWLVFKKLVSFR